MLRFIRNGAPPIIGIIGIWLTFFLTLWHALYTRIRPNKILFEYTAGHWIYNDAPRRKAKKVVFNVNGLRRLAAESVNKTFSDVISLVKLDEGGFNRTFLITFRNDMKLVARIPYPTTVPHFYAISSEVATMEYFQSCGIPTPQVYKYCAHSKNAAGTPYIIMEFIKGYRLADIWPKLNDEQIKSVVRELVNYESVMMSKEFPAGGSLYFTEELQKKDPGLGVPLEDGRFCVGPDTRVDMWCGRRSELKVDRGPYHDAEVVFIASACKEIAYLEQFAQPRLPFRCERRPAYNYQPQSPSDYIETLKQFVQVAPLVIPTANGLDRFCIRHPDLHAGNIFVSLTPDSQCKVISLIDWQHTVILPMFIQAGIPSEFRDEKPDDNRDAPPFLPLDFDEMSKKEQIRTRITLNSRLASYQYIASTREYNTLHYRTLLDPLYPLRARLFSRAGSTWEGENLELKVALMDVSDRWTELVEQNVPCPLRFVDGDREQTETLLAQVDSASRGAHYLQSVCHVAEGGWVSNENYEYAVKFMKDRKKEALEAAKSEQERNEIRHHWPWDDRDEEFYDCYI